MENIHAGHRERLKNRYLNEGLNSFEDHEILELLLYPHIPYKDTNPIAHELLLRYGSLSAVIDAHPDDLMNVKFMTKSAALYISSLKDVFKAYQKDKFKAKTTICTRACAVAQLANLLAYNAVEQAVLLCMNVKHEIVKTCVLGTGDEASCNVTVKKIVELVLRHKAVFVILGHNHPSHDVTPSSYDKSFTRSVCLILKMLGITMLDHIIIGGDNYFSFEEQGYLEKIRNEYDDFEIFNIAEKMETEILL